MTLRERIGRALLRWRPWPQVVIYGGGGVLLIVSALFWLEPGRTVRYWFRLVIGAGLILVAVLEVWLARAERGGRAQRAERVASRTARPLR